MHPSLKLFVLCLLLLLPLGADACVAGRSYHSGYGHCNRNGHDCRWVRPHHHHYVTPERAPAHDVMPDGVPSHDYHNHDGNHRT